MRPLIFSLVAVLSICLAFAPGAQSAAEAGGIASFSCGVGGFCGGQAASFGVVRPAFVSRRIFARPAFVSSFGLARPVFVNRFAVNRFGLGRPAFVSRFGFGRRAFFRPAFVRGFGVRGFGCGFGF